jgi:two-component system, cell cycle response regulator
MTQPSEQTPIALAVIDDRYKSALIHKALKNACSVFETQESFGAVDWLKHFQASVIILDEEALHKTWPLFVQHIRRLPGYSDVPILLISKNIKKSFFTQALSYGITDFLLDPLEADEVYKRVIVAINSSPISKRVAQLSKKIARASLKTEHSLPKRFLVTEDVIRQIAHSRAHQFPLALVMIEIDRFKELEEKYHRESTQKLSVECAGLFKLHLRKNDFLLPQGDARFLLILPHTSQRAGVAIAEMIRKEVESRAFTLKATSISLTLSIGFICFDADPTRSVYDQFDSFLEKVDKALMEAKGKGNKIITYKRSIA